MGKNRVGAIDATNYRVRLAVVKSNILEDGNPNCDWKWITISADHASLDAAKGWLNENFETITSNHKIKLLDV